MHPSTSSESEAQQADFQLIELGAELVEVVEMSRIKIIFLTNYLLWQNKIQVIQYAHFINSKS